MSNTNFTIEEALSVQRSNLKIWNSILKPEVFADMKSWAEEKNSKAEKPDEIVRGQLLESFLDNLRSTKHNTLVGKIQELKEIIADVLNRHPELENQVNAIASISYDNANIDTDIQDCITAIGSIEELVKNHLQNELTR
ncbi:hypothetical protein LPB90_18170 [Chryseobacterium sp. LC2016-29]|uniref:hypothetical protein n=1 Tax=Chryseobacterium sp. LC2016-29 TaxID=2897331 RepID=UPI001E298550|nr:hypothetical protein [Chryseobacterium sp. LC2016-29]MCD0480368.1 hypothetical protein [Chryseobacterium sp. LC2016-29]